MKLRLLALFGLFEVFSLNSTAQFLPISVLNDDVRREQLLGRYDSTVSFTVMPFVPAKINPRVFTDTTASRFNGRLFSDRFQPFPVKNKFLTILPFTLQQQLVSHHPYGWNDGAMIPSKGYQVLASAGVFVKLGPLSIQLRPEAVWAQNSKYPGFPEQYDQNTWGQYYELYLNRVDLPEQFGKGPYSNFLWGQSAVRLTFGAVSFGLSNENLWWGPGMRNSLLMSNTATGFKHLTFNTAKPLNIGIGSIEAQIVSGRLEASGYLPPESERLYNGIPMYAPKDNDWRYLSAAVLSYNPKWIPGLYLGISRSFYLYNKNMGNRLSDYIPLLAPFEKTKTGGIEEDSKMRDQLSSIFARWVFREANAEVYVEFARNDHSATPRDFILEPEHSRAYTVGLNKVFKLDKNRFMQFKSELTNLSIPNTYLIRGFPTMYLHHQVRDGYTNKGEVLGAGIGTGSSLKSVNFLIGNGLNKLGLQVEAYNHNQDFYKIVLASTVPDRKWEDWSVTMHGDWNLKNILLTAQLQGVRSVNYQWMPGQGVVNFVGKVGMSYYFNEESSK